MTQSREGHCCIAGCTRTIHARRMCGKHYQQWNLHGDPLHVALDMPRDEWAHRIPGYGTWSGMKQRCENPRAPSYARYGGRGIQVCERWRTFKHFLADIGKRPKGLTLERKDNNGNYSCGKCPQCCENQWAANCHWATPKEQARNRRGNRLITIDGTARCISEWEQIAGLHRTAIFQRLRRGWPEDRRLLSPTRVTRRTRVFDAKEQESKLRKVG